tara:strand:- start:147 stop:473 length:327 start_codon:yes stop_codon:yes gene_type:complete
MKKKYSNFKEFYPFYLSEHMHPICRMAHFFGTLCVFIIIIMSFSDTTLLLFAPIFGYGCAWIGHFFFEQNRPATFSYPLYSLMGDWVMFKDILIRKESILYPKIRKNN